MVGIEKGGGLYIGERVRENGYFGCRMFEVVCFGGDRGYKVKIFLFI